MAHSIELNGITYEVGRMDARSQFHVARRLAPVLGALVSAFEGGSRRSLPSGDAAVESQILELATGPLASALSEMSDDNADYIINKCLAVCQRKQDRGYAHVMVNGTLMFQDMQLDTMMGITFEVLKENLGGFFPTSQPASKPAE